MASYKAKIARLNALLDAQAQVIQEYALAIAELENRNAMQKQTAPDMHTANADKFFAQEQPQ